ncbi:Uncharacterised protein [Serratia fonticola]|uniref:hypothetical protein n=1 Tax=Serratia fonticola TaxID=47917 RepID=UPI00217856DD|nr:hypothetical protein [Serratia fonticola]CAI1872334.1 Uncharacterised protein [Serratia fonticola]
MIDARQRKLIMAVLNNNSIKKGKISDEDFISQYPVENKSIHEFIQEKLGDALVTQSHNELEYILYLGFHFGFTIENVHILNELLNCKWHQKHEDIVRSLVLVKAKDKETIDSLAQCALAEFDYLSDDREDGNYSLTWSCIYALAKIGTPYAVEKLKIIACDDIIEIKDKVFEVMKSYNLS